MGKINNLAEFLEALKSYADEDGIITNLTYQDRPDLVEYLVKNGFVKTHRDPKGRLRYVVDTDDVNDMLEHYGFFYARNNYNIEKALKIRLGKFGAIKNKKMVYRRVFSQDPNNSENIENKRLSLIRTIRGRSFREGLSVKDYLEKYIGELDMSDSITKSKFFDELRDDAREKYYTKKLIESTHDKELFVKTKRIASDALNRNNYQKSDNSVYSSAADLMLKNNMSDIRYLKKFDDFMEEVKLFILDAFPEKTISGVKDNEKKKLAYSYMEYVYYGTKHDENESISEFWNDIFACDDRFKDFIYPIRKKNMRFNKPAKERIESYIANNCTAIDSDGRSHISNIYSDNRSIYLTLRRFAKANGMTVHEYLLDKYNVVCDTSIYKDNDPGFSGFMVNATEKDDKEMK